MSATIDYERYAIPDHLAEEAHRVFVAALAEIGKEARLIELEVQGHPSFRGTPGIDEYRASTIARLAVGVEPLPDFETFYAYSTTVTRWMEDNKKEANTTD